MRAYSLDLRQRVLALVDAAELPRAAIGQLLGVSRRWRDKLVAQRRRLGHVAPLGHAGGAKLKLDVAGKERLRAAWAARPDASLAELAVAVAAGGGRPLPERAHHPPGLPRPEPHAQKKTLRATEADEQEREDFRDLVAEMPHRRFVFVDETGVNLDLGRTHARAPRGERAVDCSVPRNTPVRTGLVGAMGAAGMICSMQVAGAVDGAAFLVFVEECLGPHLRRGDFVVLDNLNTHTSPKVEAAIYRRGAFLLFLPRYSPDMNPIEGAWSKLKAHLRRVAARSAERLDAALAEGLAALTTADAHGWFAHAGYAL